MPYTPDLRLLLDLYPELSVQGIFKPTHQLINPIFLASISI